MRIVAAGGADITITSPLQAAGADGQTNSTSGIPTYDLLSGFNGATWDRLRALGDDSDGVASASLGRLLALARLSGYNGATWDRLLAAGNDSDAIANTTLGNLQTLGFQHVYNGASWDRATLLSDAADAVATDTSFGLGSLDRLTGFNGTSWDRIRTLGGTSLDGLGQLSTSGAIPGAGVVTTLLAIKTGTTTTRETIITPTSGKRVRIISCDCINNDGTITDGSEVYFGTGTNITTNPASAIFLFDGEVGGPRVLGRGWPDGAGPVGAVDAVVSLRGIGGTAANTKALINYREE